MTFKKTLALLTVLLAIFAFAPGLSAQKKKPKPKPGKVLVIPPRDPNRYTIYSAPVAAPARTPEQQRRYDTFMRVWQTIRDNYFDSTFGGLNWTEIWREFNPRVAQTKTDDELYDLLEEMIGRLNKSHFAIVPPDIYQAIEYAKNSARLKEKERQAAKAKSGGDLPGDKADKEDEFDPTAKYGIGVDLRLMNDQFLITRVLDGSSAQKAGLRTGYVVEKINDVSLKDLLKKIEDRYTHKRNVRKLLAGEVVTWMLNGDEGTDVGLTYLNEKDEARDIRIDREKLSGRAVSIGSNYPEQYLSFEQRSIGNDVGYIRFNLFALPVIADFCSALTAFKDKKAIILDLRGNHGGLFGALLGISGMLSDKEVDLGTQIYRSGAERLRASSKAKNFKGKMIVLVDELSISSAEILAAAMQDGGRALLIGEKTAGEALPALSVTLQTGAVLIYPVANLKTARGNYLEGVGVTPDIAVNIDRGSLLEGRDLQLEAALKAIKENTGIPVAAGTPRPAGSTAGDAPPPPPPMADPPPPAKSTTSVSGAGPVISGTSGAPATRVPAPAASKDVKSLELISQFLKKIGGEAAIRKIETYSIKGVSRMNIRGSEDSGHTSIYRSKPDKYSELVDLTALGELREMYNKDSFVLQTDFGVMNEISTRLPFEKREALSPVLYVADKDYLKELKYEGVFDRQGRKAYVINGKGADGDAVALAFDVETGLLVGYAGPYYTYSLGDYRKAGDLLLPFSIDRGGGVLTIYEIKVNTPIDESNFQKKVNCFDKPN
jgi:carboxyl-terminal processing protease